MKENIKNIQVSVRARLKNKTKVTNRSFVQEFLIKPMDVINKERGFKEEWKTSGSWR